MNVVILEDLSLHGRGFDDSNGIAHYIEGQIQARGHDTKIVRSLEAAASALKEKSVDWVVIHHSSFEDVRRLRGLFPNVKYAVYSENVVANPCPGTCGQAIREKMQKNYDGVLDNLDSSLAGLFVQ